MELYHLGREGLAAKHKLIGGFSPDQLGIQRLHLLLQELDLLALVVVLIREVDLIQLSLLLTFSVISAAICPKQLKNHEGRQGFLTFTTVVSRICTEIFVIFGTWDPEFLKCRSLEATIAFFLA